MKYSLFIFAFLLFTSCIPVAVKPKIEDYKITNGAKFKKGLPNQTTFIFEDPKNADEFYTYINVKFNRQHLDAEFNNPIEVNGTTYYLTFFEAERKTKTINLLPIVADAILENKNITDGDAFINTYSSRNGQWYLIITVNDEDYNDALADTNLSRDEVINFLRAMKQEYLSTANYQDIFFKNPPIKN